MIATTTGSFCEDSTLFSGSIATAVKKVVSDLHASTKVLEGVAGAMAKDFQLGLAYDYANNPSGPDGKTESAHMPLMMLPTHVDRMPTGDEHGTFLAIDLGGTNLRVCAITLIRDGNPNPITTDEQIAQAEADAAKCGGDAPHVSTIDCRNHRCVQAHYRIPEAVKTGKLDGLALFIAEMIRSFLLEHNTAYRSLAGSSQFAAIKPLIPAEGVSKDFEEGPMPTSLGFTFSFPVCQLSLKESRLLSWTKGFSIPDALGCDIAAAVQDQMTKIGLPIKVSALINDTVGTLLAHAYDNPTTVNGIILGTGTNAAYLETRKNITKLPLKDGEDPESKMIVNTEWGAFNKIFDILPRTGADVTIDALSLNPGRQLFEKTISGMYLGEVLSKTLSELMDNEDIRLLENCSGATVLRQQGAIPTKYMQWIEAKDEADRPAEASRIFSEVLGIEHVSQRDCLIICETLTAVRRRAARLSAAAIYALLRQRNLPNGNPIAVAIDGTLWLKYPNFKNTVLMTLEELLPADQMKYVTLENARDGSGMGGAVVAALYKD